MQRTLARCEGELAWLVYIIATVTLTPNPSRHPNPNPSRNPNPNPNPNPISPRCWARTSRPTRTPLYLAYISPISPVYLPGAGLAPHAQLELGDPAARGR